MSRLRPFVTAESSGEAVAPTAPVRAALIDVGPHTGALVLTADEERLGLEVEIEPVGATYRTHAYVLARETAEGTRCAALFPSLRPGRYRVLDLDGAPAVEVEVRAGGITTGQWKAAEETP